MPDIAISPSKLPTSHKEIFSISRTRRLPTPDEVRAEAALQQPPHTYPPSPVTFPRLQLLVKYGGITSIAEGQCLWMIRTCLGDRVPVPEVYGWCKDGQDVFIYMELIQGATLEQRWDQLSEMERSILCDELRPMITVLREMKQASIEGYIGNITRGPLQDIVFECLTVGPFPDISTFHNFFTQRNWDQQIAGQLPDNLGQMQLDLPEGSICFTHGDLHRSNIMVTREGQQPRILAIVDWHQSGWYPEYWEYCKAKWTAKPGDEWVSKYLPKILEPNPEAYESWNYICLSHGV